MKKSIIIIALIVIIIALALTYTALYKSKQGEPAQNQVINNNNGSDASTPAATDNTPNATSSSTTNTDSDIDTSDWNAYRNEKYGYEMKYPKEWNIETYDGKYAEIQKDQINADWIQFALYTKDEQKIKNYGESMIANVDVSVDDKYITIEDYLNDFGYDLNENTLKEGRVLLTRGISKEWMNIREEEFKGQKAYVIEYSDSGYYLYFKNQYIYKISSLWNTNEISREEILEIINTFNFINPADDIEDWKVYRNEAFGFELKYPAKLYLFDCSSNFYEQNPLYVHLTPNENSNCNSPYKAIDSLIAISHVKKFNKNDLMNLLDRNKKEKNIIIDNKLSIQISGESEVRGDEGEKLSSEPIREKIFTVVPIENNADIEIMYSRISSIKNDDNGFVVGEDLSKIYNQMLSSFKLLN